MPAWPITTIPAGQRYQPTLALGAIAGGGLGAGLALIAGVIRCTLALSA